MSIHTYLCGLADEVTGNSLKDIKTAQDWKKERPARLKRYLDQMGIAPYLQAKRTPLNVKVTGILDRGAYKIEKLYFESLPRLYVTGLLYVPTRRERKAPAVVYVCGHSENQKWHYQSHARHFCKLGFVSLVIETIQLGEIRGEHHGTYARGQFNWISRGYLPSSVECWNAIRAVDLLVARPEVDASRIGVTGISGGGGCSWWLAAADERVKVSVPVCGTGTIRSHVSEGTIDGHCDCMYSPNPGGWDLADVGALIAPRPLLVESAARDELFTVASVKETFGKVARIYGLAGAKENARLVIFPGKHGYESISRRECFAWFLKHLAGKNVTADDVEDLSTGGDESLEELRVYVHGIPADERVTIIDEDFVPKAALKTCRTKKDLAARRKEVIGKLRTHTFAFIPESIDVSPRLVQEMETKDDRRMRYELEVEKKRSIPVTVAWPLGMEVPAATLLTVKNGKMVTPVEGSKSKVVSASVETLGVGGQSWAEEYAWHLRRALGVMMGRTVAGIRVHDVLCALAALRKLEQVRKDRIWLAARGEMVPVALYAALLDGGVCGIVLSDPPATQDEISARDGKGPAIEMQSCLRVTDLPEVAALLWPAEITFIGLRPQGYLLTEETYRSLGAPGVVRRLKNLAGNSWSP